MGFLRSLRYFKTTLSFPLKSTMQVESMQLLLWRLRNQMTRLVRISVEYLCVTHLDPSCRYLLHSTPLTLSAHAFDPSLRLNHRAPPRRGSITGHLNGSGAEPSRSQSAISAALPAFGPGLGALMSGEGQAARQSCPARRAANSRGARWRKP